MKVVHLCLASFFPDGYSYQENMLPKFHKQLGYEVEVIASTQTFDKNGNKCYMDKMGSYFNENDIKVTRLQYKSEAKIWKKLKKYQLLYPTLEEANPDILFIHGLQFLDINKVVSYLKKNKNVVVYIDNHADFSNSATNWLSKNILHKIIWRYCAKIINPYVKKFYGVLPVRVDFLIDIYKLPKEKCDLLVMGADDDIVEKVNNNDVRKKVRKKYHIEEDDFLIMTGGKIDSWKMQTLLLMDAVNQIKNDKVKLIVFGSVTEELKQSVQNLTSGNKVQYIGWVSSEDSYSLFSASDLVVFPGRHSVFWEQVAGLGIPMLVKEWQGTKHVDLGGNVLFLENDSVDEIKLKIEMLYNNPIIYKKMLNIAKNRGMEHFSYRMIAKKSIS